jgi:hypothetical protein
MCFFLVLNSQIIKLVVDKTSLHWWLSRVVVQIIVKLDRRSWCQCTMKNWGVQVVGQKGVSLGWVGWDKRNQEWRGNMMKKICHTFLHRNLSYWVVLDEPGTSKSQVLQKHSDSRVSMFLGLQLKEVEIRCIVAFSGKVVSGLHGPNEPWEFWPQRPYLDRIFILSNMHRSWAVNSSWPLRRCKLQIQAFVTGLTIRRYENSLCWN